MAEPSSPSIAAAGNNPHAVDPSSSPSDTRAKQTKDNDNSAEDSKPPPPRTPGFPAHNAPRVWFITSASSAVGISLSRHLLSHGDYIVAGVSPSDLNNSNNTSSTPSNSTGTTDDPTAAFRSFLDELSEPSHAAWKSRFKPVPLDIRVLGQCQSAVAEAVVSFGRIDVLLVCSSLGVVGAVEELAGTLLARDQFEVNFFGPVNVIKAVLPTFRTERNGHVVVMTGTTGHLGTPGLGIYCASQWAMEGYCDSLAYEVAPFNIRTTIVQPNVEVGLLTNKVVAAPPLPPYEGDANAAPLFREILSSLLDRLERTDHDDHDDHDHDDHDDHDGRGAPEPRSSETDKGGRGGPSAGDLLHRDAVTALYPTLPRGLRDRLVAETVHAVAAIGGHDNPPGRHIVGHEAVASVKEKLKTVSEELEDFVEVSAAVDIGKGLGQGLEP